MSLDYKNILKSPVFWIAVVLILGSYVGVFWLGTIKAREWADSEYLQEREERTKQIAVHQAREKELYWENEKLKSENELKAQLLRDSDTAAEAKRASEFQKLRDKREQKYDEIQNADPDTSAAGLCKDAKAAGIKLSFCE